MPLARLASGSINPGRRADKDVDLREREIGIPIPERAIGEVRERHVRPQGNAVEERPDASHRVLEDLAHPRMHPPVCGTH